MSNLSELCEALARDAGRVLCDGFERRDQLATSSKSTATDPVSEIDLAAERVIRDRLARERPDDGVLGEEQGDVPGTTGYRWVVDPLDGTVNYLFGLPQFCVSVAVEDGDGTLAGAIYDPIRDDCFRAARGGDARLDGGPALRGSRQDDLSRALVATGFAYDPRVRVEQAAIVARLVAAARDVRRLGSAALDLAWTAAGRYDAYFERGVKPWDVAAGLLLCERAGLTVRALPKRGILPEGVLVAPAALVEPLLALEI